ncbi:MAG TPA: hypothetical protein VHB77_10520 [Planctomycetaceae bacterium]|nr:hypothetical protein [Planctomycetaceae bacterium]
MEPHTRMSRLNLAFCAAGVGSALLVLYVLSTGPFCWLIAHEHISEDLGIRLSKLIYAPIIWSVDNSQTADAVLQAWIDWWTQ